VSGELIDLHGNVLMSDEERNFMVRSLKEYIAKYKSRFDDWFRMHGAMSRPPVKFDRNRRTWEWID
jgi:hypothetical protein